MSNTPTPSTPDTTQPTKLVAVQFPGIDQVELHLPAGAKLPQIIDAVIAINRHLMLAGWEHYADLVAKVSPVGVQPEQVDDEDASHG